MGRDATRSSIKFFGRLRSIVGVAVLSTEVPAINFRDTAHRFRFVNLSKTCKTGFNGGIHKAFVGPIRDRSSSSASRTDERGLATSQRSIPQWIFSPAGAPYCASSVRMRKSTAHRSVGFRVRRGNFPQVQFKDEGTPLKFCPESESGFDSRRTTTQHRYCNHTHNGSRRRRDQGSPAQPELRTSCLRPQRNSTTLKLPHVGSLPSCYAAMPTKCTPKRMHRYSMPTRGNPSQAPLLLKKSHKEYLLQ